MNGRGLAGATAAVALALIAGVPALGKGSRAGVYSSAQADEGARVYAARDLWQDHTVIPVRGQTGWLVPQPGVNYSLRSNNMSVMSKADGMVVMNTNPDIGDMLGVGDSMELPNRAPIEEAMATLSRFFVPPARRGAA